MKRYVCDNCEKNCVEPAVVLNGITGTSGGILLPERFSEKHFCTKDCFWSWVVRYYPKKAEKIDRSAVEVRLERFLVDLKKKVDDSFGGDLSKMLPQDVLYITSDQDLIVLPREFFDRKYIYVEESAPVNESVWKDLLSDKKNE